MSDATLPIWALVVIPLGSAAVGALSGPVTERFRSASEWRNRQADRDAVAKTRSAEIQRDTIRQLLAAMSDFEEAVIAVIQIPDLGPADRESRIGALLNRADSLRVLVPDEKSMELTLKAIVTLQKFVRGETSGETAGTILREMTDQLGVVYRCLLP